MPYLPIVALTVTVEDAQTSLPAPTGSSDGVAIATWGTHRPPYYPPEAEVTITVAGAVTLSAAALWEYLDADAKWLFVGYLNQGAPIVIAAATQGFKQIVERVRGTRIALSATLSSAVATTVKATPYSLDE